ncbi:MAG: hypothetical protein ACU0CT_02605 [Paracoccaceae bacterium]
MNEEAHAVAKAARKSGDPRAADFTRIARETDALMDMCVPDAPVRGANVEVGA